LRVAKPLLRSLVPADLAPVVSEFGGEAYRARQLAGWLHTHDALQWEEMRNLPRPLLAALAGGYDLQALTPVERQVSADGTRKFLFRLRDGQTVESVIIPMESHTTFCLSTQVGCAMACRFCATARGGLVRNLEAGEILEQVTHLRRDLTAEPVPGHGDRQFNVVFMGMGEPLDNWEALPTVLRIMMDDDGLGMSKRRIQVSTSGPGEGLRRLVAAAPGVGLTISLGGTTDEERRRLMPVPGRTPLAEVIELGAHYARQSNRRTTIAWVLIAGRTDQADQARRLAKLAGSGPFKVNLIPLNALDDDAQAPPSQAAVLAFQEILTRAGIDSTVRLSGGRDIAAACGQLRRRRLAI
jgi:23S rRNA (adenine2503-C2)-methyltransferase